MKASSSPGFTIIELLVSIAMIGFIVLGVVAMNNSLGNINKRARDTSLAVASMETKFESLRSKGYNAVTIGTTNFTSELPSELSGPKSASYSVDLFQLGIKRITMTVNYTANNQTKTYTQTSFLGELGVGQ